MSDIPSHVPAERSVPRRPRRNLFLGHGTGKTAASLRAFGRKKRPPFVYFRVHNMYKCLVMELKLFEAPSLTAHLIYLELEMKSSALCESKLLQKSKFIKGTEAVTEKKNMTQAQPAFVLAHTPRDKLCQHSTATFNF